MEKKNNKTALKVGVGVIVIAAALLIGYFAVRASTSRQAEEFFTGIMTKMGIESWDYDKMYVEPITKTYHLDKFGILDEAGNRMTIDKIKAKAHTYNDEQVDVDIDMSGARLISDGEFDLNIANLKLNRVVVDMSDLGDLNELGNLSELTPDMIAELPIPDYSYESVHVGNLNFNYGGELGNFTLMVGSLDTTGTSPIVSSYASEFSPYGTATSVIKNLRILMPAYNVDFLFPLTTETVTYGEDKSMKMVMNMQSNDVFDFDFELNMSNLDFTNMDPNDYDYILSVIYASMLDGVSMTFTDKGFVGKIFTIALGSDNPTMRGVIVQGLRGISNDYNSVLVNGSAVINYLADFVEKPGSKLTLYSDAEAPVSMLDMAEQNIPLNDLNLTMSVNDNEPIVIQLVDSSEDSPLYDDYEYDYDEESYYDGEEEWYDSWWNEEEYYDYDYEGLGEGELN